MTALTLSFNPLWKLLIDKGMNKKELRAVTGISASTMAKLGRNENVTTSVLLRICQAFDCQISDIIEVTQGGNA